MPRPSLATTARYCLFVGVVLFSRGTAALHAGDALDVRFDCGPAIFCRDVTPDEFSETNPDEKIVEATVRISARVDRGKIGDLRELLYEMQSPGQRARVFAFSPQTQLRSDIAEPIRIIKTQDKHRSLGATLGATVAAPGPVEAKASPAANIGQTVHDGLREETSKIPAKKPVIISGTSHHEHGVFFKFKASTQTSLEGVRELTCRFVVPKTWRGDWLLLSCRATGVRTRYLIKGLRNCGDARFVVGLYIEGDADAKDAAQRLAGAQLPARSAVGSFEEASESSGDASTLRSASDYLRTFAGDIQ